MSRNIYHFILIAAFFCFQGVIAQETNVTGVVTDVTGIPLPGGSVIVKGTSNGVVTDFDGNYSIVVSDPSAILVFSFIGFSSQELAVEGNNTVNVSMEEDTEQLGEIVITALGVKREAKSLGYSSTRVGGDEIATVKQTNAINSLQGKVAGVQVTQNSTGAAGSSRVIIRGNNTLTGNNQPLYVVDGIPISNDNNGAVGIWGGSDGGDGISSINPDDIESIQVLKGGASTALYGSRGGEWSNHY